MDSQRASDQNDDASADEDVWERPSEAELAEDAMDGDAIPMTVTPAPAEEVSHDGSD